MTARRPGFPARLDLQSGRPRPATPAGGAVPQRGAAAPSASVHKPASTAAVGRVLPAPVALAIPRGLGMDSAAVRNRMVQKIAAGGIDDAAVLAALQAVERHRFVDSALVNQAYEDTSLPIGLEQTISKPSVVARMLSLLRAGLVTGDGPMGGRLLEIGTGCGYQAAVMSHLATEVYSIERLRGLHERARENLRPFRLANVHLIFGDGMAGFAQGAPYAGIVAAAGGEAVPQAWLDQLAVGGRLVAPLVTATGQQALVVIDRQAQGFSRRVLEAVHFVPLKSGIA
jgi:protein-L-isoaspartate(D-aspartate) O-methyltransferase